MHVEVGAGCQNLDNSAKQSQNENRISPRTEIRILSLPLQVIVALQERSQGKARSHVPYRNSTMTSVLRDSLGGNCRTVMIATVNTSAEQLEETISTCRFAQRVAQISNQVYVNEELDPVLVIRRLKQEIRDLKVGYEKALKGVGLFLCCSFPLTSRASDLPIQERPMASPKEAL